MYFGRDQLFCLTTAPGNSNDAGGDPDVAFLGNYPSNDDVTASTTQKHGGAHAAPEIHPQDDFRRPMIADYEPVEGDSDNVGISFTEDVTRKNNFPLFIEKYDVGDCFIGEKILLFTAPITAEGRVVNVYNTCAYGVCDCVHMLDGVKSQLRPCRFAYLLYGGFVKNVSAHELIYNGICDGFRIVDREVEGYSCSNYASILSDTSKNAMDIIVSRELNESYVTIVDYKPTCVHALGAVPKGINDIRPITDCSRPEGRAVNDHCATLVKKFTYNSIQDVVDIINPGSMMSVIDIQAAYRAVPVFPPHRDYLGFSWAWEGKDRYFVDNRLCFGLSTGPYYFHSISCFIAEILKNVFDVALVHYLDDYIVIAPTLSEALRDQNYTISTLRYLGFYISWKKISTPSTCTIYLGIQIDTIKMELSLPSDKVEKFKKYVNKYVIATYITRKELEQLNGLLAHCAQIVQGGRIFTRRCFDQYKVLVAQKAKRIRISPGMRQDLEWWSLFAPYINGVNLIPYKIHDVSITTDASMKGFGAVHGADWLFGAWDGSLDQVFVQTKCGHLVAPPSLDQDQLENINVLELWAVIAALERWAPRFQDTTLVLYIDNMQVVYMIRNGASINKQCMSWIRRLFWLKMKFNVVLRPLYIPTEDNVAADTLSRIPYGMPFEKFTMLLSELGLCCWSELCATILSRGGSPGGGCQTLSADGSGKVNQDPEEKAMGLLC